MDVVLPRLSFEIHRCAPKTCTEAKTLALNLENPLREMSHQAVSTVGQSSLAETQFLEHKIDDLQINSIH